LRHIFCAARYFFVGQVTSSVTLRGGGGISLSGLSHLKHEYVLFMPSVFKRVSKQRRRSFSSTRRFLGGTTPTPRARLAARLFDEPGASDDDLTPNRYLADELPGKQSERTCTRTRTRTHDLVPAEEALGPPLRPPLPRFHFLSQGHGRKETHRLQRRRETATAGFKLTSVFPRSGTGWVRWAGGRRRGAQPGRQERGDANEIADSASISASFPRSLSLSSLSPLSLSHNGGR